MGYAFISYSTKNQSVADAVRNLLNKNGLETWMAPGDIPVGKKYAGVINRAVKECACFILLLSNDAQKSEWVPKEVERAINYHRPIIPLKLEELTLNDEFELYISNNHIIAIQKVEENLPEIRQLLTIVRTYADGSTVNKDDLDRNDPSDGNHNGGEPKRGRKKWLVFAAPVLAAVIAVSGIAAAVRRKSSRPEQTAAASSVAETQATTETTRQDAETTAQAAQTDWKAAYVSYLTEHLSQAWSINAYFSLIYLNGDDVPELVVSYDDLHASGAMLVMLRNGQIVEYQAFGSWGTFQYIEKCEMLYSSMTNQGALDEFVYRLTDDGRTEAIWHGVMKMGMTEDSFTYESNGAAVTESQYENARRVYIASDDWVKQTNEPNDVLLYQTYTSSAIAELQRFELP